MPKVRNKPGMVTGRHWLASAPPSQQSPERYSRYFSGRYSSDGGKAADGDEAAPASPPIAKLPEPRLIGYYAAMQRAPDDAQPMTAEQAATLIPARRVVVHAAVAHIQALDDREPKRRAALDDPPAHSAYVVARYARSIARRFRSASEQ